MNKNLLIFLFASVSVSTMQPISLQTAYGVTGAVGGLTGIGTSYFAYKNKFPFFPIWGLGAGAIAAGVTYYFIHQYTPEGRYAKALSLIHKAGNCPMSEQSFQSEKEFFSILGDLYVGEDWWLVTAFNELAGYLDGCRKSLDLLAKAHDGSVDNYALAQQCGSLTVVARKYVLNLATALKRIKAHKDYISQMKEFKRAEIERQKMVIEQQKASAAQAQAGAQWHSANAQWHMARN